MTVDEAVYGGSGASGPRAQALGATHGRPTGGRRSCPSSAPACGDAICDPIEDDLICP